MSIITELLKGPIDMHIHGGPDPRVERRADALEIARQAREVGMRAVVLKSHEYPTTPVAHLVNQLVEGITMFGSISLDLEVGGLNIYALEASAKLGAKVVWMPILTAANDMKKKGIKEEGITILDRSGKLLPVVDRLLDIIKSHETVLCTGHISAEETFALVDRALRNGITKIVVTHPLTSKTGAVISVDEQRKPSQKGAFIEYCFGVTMPMSEQLMPAKMAKAIQTVGAEHSIVSTDFGQAHNPAPAEGMRMAIATMLRHGLSEKEVEFTVKTNPARLLGMC